MFRNSNGAVIRRLSGRSLKSNQSRNVIAAMAIALTALLFTSLFTIGGSMLKTTQETTMRQIGTRAHGGFKYLTQAEYDALAADTKIKDISYNIILGFAENEALRYFQTEIRCGEDKDAQWMMSYPAVGDMPRSGRELATSTRVLDALGIPHELGQPVTLEFTVQGRRYTETFTLCGFWEGDEVMVAQQVWLSREYFDSVVELIDRPYNEIGTGDLSGTISADVFFHTSWDIESQMDDLALRAGMNPETAHIGVNWAYVTSEMDATGAILIGLVLALILGSGYLIIYNIFYISVARDIRFYGMLKTIGATGRQLKRIVRRQGLLLACAGIPLGLIFGWLSGQALVPVVMSFTMYSQDYAVSFDPVIFVGAALFTFLTVYVSCIKPCRLAARVSPVEALRYTENDGGVKGSAKKSGRVTPMAMALANLRRSRKKTVAVVLSLSLSMILLNSVYTAITGFDMEKYLKNRLIADFQLTHYSLMNPSAPVDDFHGVTPQARAEIAGLTGLERVGNIYMNEALHVYNGAGVERTRQAAEQWGEAILAQSAFASEALRMATEEGMSPGHIYGLDPWPADQIEIIEGKFDLEKFLSGDYVIVSAFTKFGAGEGRYYDVGDKVTLEFGVYTADQIGSGRSKEYEVMAIGRVPYAIGPQHSHFVSPEFLLPSSEFLAGYGDTQPMHTIFDVEDTGTAAAEAWISNYCANVNPDLAYGSRAFYEKEFAGFQNVYAVVGGSLSFILALIGILNFINSVATAILARRREFAMLQAVGMTGKQLKEMLVAEGGIYAGCTLLFTATLGTAASYLVTQAIAGQVAYFVYRFTLLPVFLCIPVLLVIAGVVPLLCYREMCRQSVVERLREAE